MISRPSRWLTSLVFALALASALAAGSALGAVTQVEVRGVGGKHCTAYFHHHAATPTWPIMLSLRGTGIYTTATDSRLDPAERALLDGGTLTILTLDKPGISAVGDEARVDDAQYNAYVQEDLLACASEALSWAARPSEAGAGILLLSGHSEGAQIVVRLLERLTAAKDPLAARVRGLFLSGLPMADWRHLLAAQLSTDDQRVFFTAFQRRDDHVLRGYGNLSSAYLEGVFAGDPLGRTLDRLAAEGSAARYYIYQGLEDRRTPASLVRDYVTANRLRLATHRPALAMSARFYAAPHGLNGVALRDITRDIRALLATPTLQLSRLETPRDQR